MSPTDDHALSATRDLAERGVSLAQFFLGFRYLSGIGEQKNLEEARRWLQKAAVQRDGNAAYFLGLIHDKGLGIVSDMNEAAKWYRLAAFEGQDAAQEAIARMYLRGAGVGRSDVIALRWFRRAAQQGNVAAQLALSRMFIDGVGSIRDDALAYQWASIAQRYAKKEKDVETARRLLASLGAYQPPEQVSRAAQEWTPTQDARAAELLLGYKIGNGAALDAVLQQKKLVVNWRSRELPLPAISQIALSLNGRPIPSPSVVGQDRMIQKPSLLVLFDNSDPSRTGELQTEKKLALRLIGQLGDPGDADVASYSSSFQLVEPRDYSAASVALLVDRVQPSSAPTHLGKALEVALQLPSIESRDRRGLFVFTDGHSDDALDARRLAELADEANVSVSFVIVEGNRSADLETLSELSRLTGGQMVRSADVEAFLRAPFALLNAGFQLSAIVPPVRRLAWEAPPRLEVRIVTNRNELTLASLLPVNAASWSESVWYLLRAEWLSAAAVLSFFALLVLSVSYVRVRRQEREKSVSRLMQAVHPTLENIASGACYILNSPVMSIGRDSSNDIVLDDETVSRTHAILKQSEPNRFTVEDKSSANGVLVNHERVARRTLLNGDLITLGTQTFRFSAFE